MKIESEYYRFSEKEISLMEKVEIGGKIYYRIPKTKIFKKTINKAELIELIKRSGRVEEILLFYDCSFSYLRQKFMDFFKEGRFNPLKRMIESGQFDDEN